MGDWLIRGLATSLFLTLGWFYFTKVLPRKAADRAARPNEQPLSRLPGVENEEWFEVDAETSMISNKVTHDVFVSEASDLLLQSRGEGLFAETLLAEAAEKAGDAIKLRPGSFDANLLAGEIAFKRADIADTAGAIAFYQEAAVRLAVASETKKGVVDAYVGRGWAHLERAYLLEDKAAASAFLDASEVFLAGFRVSPQNLFILRGWGLSIDGLARILGDNAAPVLAAEDGYRLALAEHRDGDHELHDWYARARSSDEPVRIAMPQIRDRY